MKQLHAAVGNMSSDEERPLLGEDRELLLNSEASITEGYVAT